MSARDHSLALRALEGAGPRVRRLLAGDDAPAALERCLRAARAALLERLGEDRPGSERRQLEAQLDAYFAGDEVGRELGTLLRGRRLSVEDLEFLFVEHCSGTVDATGFGAALAVLEHAFAAAAGAEPALANLPIERLTAALRAGSAAEPPPGVVSPAEGLAGEVSAESISARDVIGTQVHIHPRAPAASPETGTGAQDQAAVEDGDQEHRLRSCYLHRVMDSAGFLALSGVDPAVAGSEADAALRLDAVYTALLTQAPQDPERLAGGAREMAAGGAPPNVAALEQLNRHRRLVLLGDPGSGKSTFANFVALCLAGELLGNEQANLELLTAPLPAEKAGDDEAPAPAWDHGALLPVPVILRDFAARGLPARGETGTAGGLWRFLEGELERAAMADYAPYLKQTLQRDGGLILLDGLDEVPAAEGRRRQILDAVRDFAASFGACRFLVTCRTYAYQHQKWRLPGPCGTGVGARPVSPGGAGVGAGPASPGDTGTFAVAILDSLNQAQIRHFVDRWYAHVAQLRQLDAADAAGRAEILKAAIFSGDRLRPLAERPLLLTLMASLHAWRGGSLPERREELYHDAVQLLLDFWEQRRVVVDAGGKPVVRQESLAEWLRVDRARVRRLLNQLACRAHAAQPDLAGTADIAEADLVARLIRVSDNPDVKPARLVEYLRDRAGLLLARGVGVYTFPHRTFQEYLAACHLTDHDFPEGLAELARSDHERWREVTLLAGAKAARGSAATPWNLADALCYRAVDSEQRTRKDVHGGHLAGLLLAESAGLSEISERLAAQLERVRAWQVDLLAGSELPARDRAECGRSLARLGDPRPEVTAVESMQLCLVPAGSFRMGSDSGTFSFLKTSPANDAPLPYGFRIGRFPVTRAQFQGFIDDDGYGEQRYWPEAIDAGAWRGGVIETRDWQGGDYRTSRASEPMELPEPFGFSNHPVVGVSWFEARAFCRWLTDRLRREGTLAEDWRVDLPSEPEWEKAARGGFEIPASPITCDLRSAGDVETAAELVENPQPRRRYPWGKEIDAEHANWIKTGIGTTSAVGCFPAGCSPYGCEEMSGNVWEWTRSQQGDYPYPENTEDREERERFAKAAAGFVLRGGGFGRDHDDVRCAARFDLDPAFRLVVVGFRVVLSPSAL